MLVYLTRHAQPVVGETAPRPGRKPLTELGREQARRLGRRLADAGFAGTVYSSPFRRTVETADIVCEQAGLSFYPEPGLHEIGREWVHGFDGLTLAEIEADYPSCASDAGPLPEPWAPRTEESLEDARARIEATLEGCLADRTEDVLLVTHGGPSGIAVDALCGEQVDSQFRGDIGYNLHYNTGLTAIDTTGTPTLAFGNDTGHLSADQVTSNATTVE